MARRWKNPILQEVIGYAGIGVTRLTQLMPLGAVRWLGKALGLLAYYAVPRLHRIGMDNLDQAYGDSLSRRQKVQILKETAANMGIVGAEFGRIPYIDEAFLRNQFTFEGLEHLDPNRGAVFIGAHYGNWEWMAPAMLKLSLPTTEVVRPMDHSRLHEFVDGIRQSNGVVTLKRERAGAQLVRLLRQGYMVGILVDQNPRANAAPVTFFGRPCWSTVAPVIASLRTGAPVHGIRTIRQPTGGYHLEITPPIPFEQTGSFRGDLVANAQRCQNLIEQWTRQYPGHWMWFHRRWRERAALVQKWRAKDDAGKLQPSPEDCASLRIEDSTFF